MENFIDSLFRSPEEKLNEALDDKLARRVSSKDNLAKNLKEKLFFNDAEVAVIFEIVDNSMAKIDLFLEKANYENYDSIASKNLEAKLNEAREDMMKEIQDKIKEIMKKKVARAREYFGKK